MDGFVLTALKVRWPRPPYRSIGDMLDNSGGIGVGFDSLRVLFAITVVMCHQQSALLGTPFPKVAPYTMVSALLLPMFFALAGFLIAGSASRLSLPQYGINRGLRIFPALIVETVLSALILGPIFTSLPLIEYFTHPETLVYFLNVIGWIHYTLPGVFTDNPHSGVNWSLWTVPFELKCYVIGAALIPLLAGRRIWLLPAVIIIWTMIAPNNDPWPYADVLRRHFLSDQGFGLFLGFLFGYVGYGLRHYVPWSPVLASVIFATLIAIAFSDFDINPHMIAIWFSGAYLTVFVGVARLPKLPVLGRGDYSYGIYLYGSPVQQAVRAAFPGLQSSVVYLLLVAVFLLPLAMFSWHCVEKPVLRWRKRFSFMVRARGIATAADSAVAAPEPVVDLRTGRVLTFGEADVEPNRTTTTTR